MRSLSSRSRPLLRLALGVVAAGACTSDEWPLADDEADTSSDGGEESTTADPIDGAHLEVFEPESPSIHYIGDTVPLLAEVRDGNDAPYAIDDLVWTAGPDEPALLFGREGAVELAPGIYDITATARLPDGDRLESTVGGLRVQTRWTGQYSGTTSMVLHVDFQGTPLAPACNGPLEVLVGFDGDTVVFQDGTCTLNAIITTLDGTYSITGEFANGVGFGTIDYELGGLLQLSFGWTGAFTDEGFLGAFEGTVPLPFVGTADVTGRFDAPFVTPWVEPP